MDATRGHRCHRSHLPTTYLLIGTYLKVPVTFPSSADPVKSIFFSSSSSFCFFCAISCAFLNMANWSIMPGPFFSPSLGVPKRFKAVVVAEELRSDDAVCDGAKALPCASKMENTTATFILMMCRNERSDVRRRSEKRQGESTIGKQRLREGCTPLLRPGKRDIISTSHCVFQAGRRGLTSIDGQATTILLLDSDSLVDDGNRSRPCYCLIDTEGKVDRPTVMFTNADFNFIVVCKSVVPGGDGV